MIPLPKSRLTSALRRIGDMWHAQVRPTNDAPATTRPSSFLSKSQPKGTSDYPDPSRARQAVPATELYLTFSERREVQERLLTDGYYRGEVDGLIGVNTRDALRVFQRANSLHTNGRLTPSTLEALGMHLVGMEGSDSRAFRRGL